MDEAIFTIGHSNHPLPDFIALLEQHGITLLCDIRSTPYSRMNPQSNRENLRQSLADVQIGYLFLGRELGARSEDGSCYVDGKVRYDRLARTDLFLRGLDRVRQETSQHRVALMCAEKDPLECHRAILVARHLLARGVAVEHILGSGSLESHGEATSRLLLQLHLAECDLFRSRDDTVEEAYRIQGQRISYEASDPAAQWAESARSERR